MGSTKIADRLVGVVRRRSSPTGVVALVREFDRRGDPAAARPPAPGLAGQRPESRTRARRTGQALGTATMLLALGGCSALSGMFGNNDGPPQEAVSVFEVTVGQCFTARQQVQAELSSLDAVPCNGPHRQEAFAVVAYQPPTGVQGDAFPGDAVLAAYAGATCAQDFETYVGISYLDSSLFFTYLLPSARGWEQSKDRSVICFATTTGPELTSSVKESRT